MVSPLPDDAEEGVDRESGVARPTARRNETRDTNRPLQAEDVRAALADHGRELVTNLTVLTRALEGAAGTKVLVLVATDLVTATRGSELQRLARAAAASRVSLHVLQAAAPAWLQEFKKPTDPNTATSTEPASGLNTEAGDPIAVASGGLPAIAAAGGGHVYSLGGGAPTQAVDALAGELEGFYAVEVDARDADRDGEPHRVSVRLHTAGLQAAVRPMWVSRNDKRDLPPPPPAPVPAEAARPGDPPTGTVDARVGERPAAPSPPPSVASARPPRLDDLLRLVSAYIATFEKEFSSVVAEERLEQMFRPLVSTSAKARRQLTRADYLLVQNPDGDGWLPFRDVFEVDGTPVHGREDRLRRLFLERRPGATEEARRIADESARYNIGNVTRTMNVPTLPLLFLRANSRGRFRFKLAGSEMIGPLLVWKIRFNETSRPTFVSDTRGGNIPATGTFWIDPETGAVVRSELQLRGYISASATVNYAPGVVANLWVPAEMREQYEGRGGLISTIASYSNFRRFQVLVEEVIK
jgi:hypothetical protein